MPIVLHLPRNGRFESGRDTELSDAAGYTIACESISWETVYLHFHLDTGYSSRPPIHADLKDIACMRLLRQSCYT